MQRMDENQINKTAYFNLLLNIVYVHCLSENLQNKKIEAPSTE